MKNVDTKIRNTEEGIHEFNHALTLFVQAGYDLLKVWPVNDVKNYPEYLPSFDEHLLHLRCIEPDDCDKVEVIASTQKQTEAYARLFTSAPELLEALELIEHWNDSSTAQISDEAQAELEPIFKKCSAAIAKVRGG